MNLLEVLRTEEKKALDRPPTRGHYMAGAQEIFPYLKHSPFVDLITAHGDVLRMEQEGPRHHLIAVADPANGLLQLYRQERDHQRQLVLDAVQSLQGQHGFEVTCEELNRYQLELAGRALDYARQHLPAIEHEAPNLQPVAHKTSQAKKDWITDLEAAFKDPTVLISQAIGNIRHFYEHEMRREA